MLYDGDCGFCERLVLRFKKITGDAVEYAPYQEALSRFPAVTEAACKEAVRLVLPGAVLSGAHAVFKALALAERFRLLHACYEHVPLFGRISEVLYQWVAHHRLLLSKLLRGKTEKCG